jgi:hypothetical protein
MRRGAVTLVLGTLLAAAQAGADVTIVQATTGKGGPIGLDGESTSYLKSSRMRIEQTVRGKRIVTIIDLDKQQFISIDDGKKEAEITDMGSIAKSMQAFKAEDVRAAVTPTGNKKAILGHDAAEYEMNIVVPFQVPEGGGDMPLTIAMGGPVWVARNAPGAADYQAFYRTAAEKGFVFTDPRQAKASPGQARGMLELYRKMADAGVPLVTTMQMKFEGAGPMAAMMSKMGGMNITTTVTSITEGPIDAAKFEIPAGYKVKQNK